MLLRAEHPTPGTATPDKHRVLKLTLLGSFPGLRAAVVVAHRALRVCRFDDSR